MRDSENNRRATRGLEKHVTGEARPCPTCGTDVGEAGEFVPFCSRRCRDVDLGYWFSGAYKLTREIKDSDLETVD